ncbi:hypothetical protein G9A89_017283 [Geosiphon pyriformis]|nr:hypothetical protein G9A89_017283 [Geosiphon pyriformis]
MYNTKDITRFSISAKKNIEKSFASAAKSGSSSQSSSKSTTWIYHQTQSHRLLPSQSKAPLTITSTTEFANFIENSGAETIIPPPGPNEVYKPQGETIRINMKKIMTKPSGYEIDTYYDVCLSVTLLIPEHLICLAFNAQKDKLCIHMNEIYAMKYAQYKELEIFVKPSYKRIYYDENHRTNLDPTNGLFEEIESIVVIPTPYVNLYSIRRISTEFKIYKSTFALEQAKSKQKGANNSTSNWDDGELCVSLSIGGVEKYELMMPLRLSLMEAIEQIEKVTALSGIKESNMFFRDVKGKDQALNLDESWNLAKQELVRHNRRRIYVGFGFGKFVG